MNALIPRKEAFLLPAIFLTAFLFSLPGLNPSFYMDDSPETVTACVTFGIPHPPGYPLATLLGHLFTLLPLGHSPFRVNLLSAVMGGALCTGLYLLMTRKLEVPRLLALPLSLLWITGAAAYPASLSAKTGIYEMTGLFLLAILAALLTDKLPLACFLYGLSFTNHWMSMLFFLPGFAVLAHGVLKERAAQAPLPGAGSAPGSGGEEAPAAPERSWLPSGRALVLFNLFFLGFTLYLVLPLRAHWGPALDWGEPTTLKGWIQGFLRSQYTPGEGKGSAVDWFGQFGLYLATAARESPWLMPFVLLGLLAGIRKGGWRNLGLLLAWGPLVGALCLYLDLPKDRTFLIGDYSLPAHLFLPIFAAGGLLLLREALRGKLGKDPLPLLAAAILLLLGLQGFQRWKKERQTHYTYVHDLCLNAFKAVPRGALYYVRGDSLVFSTWFFQWVEGKRRDLAAVGVDGLPMDWVRRALSRDHPDLHVPFSPSPLGAESAPALMEWVQEKNPGRSLWLSYVKTEDGTLPGVRSLPYGVCSQAFGARETPMLEEGREREAWAGLRLRNMRVPGFPVDDRTERTIVREYAVYRNALGVKHEDMADALKKGRGDAARARDLLSASALYQASYQDFLWAQAWSPEVAEHPFNVGNALYNMGRGREALPWYEKAVALRPDYLDAMFNAGVAAYETGQYPLAKTWFEKVLALDPNHAQARHGLDYIVQQGLGVQGRPSPVH